MLAYLLPHKVFNGGKVEHRKEKSATRRDESDEEIHQERRRVWQPCDSSLQRPTIPAIWASFQSEPVIGGTGWLKFMKVRFCMHATDFAWMAGSREVW